MLLRIAVFFKFIVARAGISHDHQPALPENIQLVPRQGEGLNRLYLFCCKTRNRDSRKGPM